MRSNETSIRERGRMLSVAEIAPPIDVEAFYARCMGNPSFACTLLGALEATAIQHVEDIARHARGGDYGACAMAAHTFRGAAAIVAADRLASLADKAQTAAEMGEVSRLCELVELIRQETERCLEQIPHIYERYQVEESR